MASFLLADIGGTNARFSLVPAGEGEATVTEIYQVRENPTFIDALKKFCDEKAKGHNIAAAAIAIAGPVLGETVKLTNSPWIADKKEIQKVLSTERVYLFNDFEAAALAVPGMPDEETDTLQVGEKSDTHPFLVLGPGTGLGVAAVAKTGERKIRPFATEAGHTRYAPADEREERIVAILACELGGFVAAEHLISGPGLVRLFKANCALAEKPFAPCEPAEIVTRARRAEEVCRQTLDDFSSMLGSFASRMALSWLALGGVYLTGGVLQKLGDDFRADLFLKRFHANPAMPHLLTRMPVRRIQAEIPAFKGLRTFLKG